MVDKRAVSQEVNFLALDRQATRGLDTAFASHDDGIQSFVLTLRYHLGTAYYSAPAIKSAFAYTGPPQPDSFADFKNVPHERRPWLGCDRGWRGRRRAAAAYGLCSADDRCC